MTQNFRNINKLWKSSVLTMLHNDIYNHIYIININILVPMTMTKSTTKFCIFKVNSMLTLFAFVALIYTAVSIMFGIYYEV